MIDLTDPSAYGSIQPFAVVGITVLAYIKLILMMVRINRRLVDDSRKQDKLV